MGRGMKLGCLAALLACGVGGGAADAQVAPAPPPVVPESPLITDPVWIVGPDTFDLAPFYPPSLTGGESATIELECYVLPDGFLGRCEPLSDPEAARPFRGASQRVTVNLQLTPPPAPETPAVATPEAPPPIPAPPTPTVLPKVRLTLAWAPPADPVAAAARLTPPGVIDEAQWRAGGFDFPERAASRGIESGRVGLICVAAATGRVDRCSVYEESPAGAGFGQAALRGIRRKHVTPATLDGQPIADLFITTVRFQMESEEAAAARLAAAAAESAATRPNP